ncbi:unnamed protein product [Linum tenue]|uniref:Uncharacterized protein n=1 Tax=Linum tenue TaxID=586396 RepID=A0AAV0PIJ1_9ROSI|nr:unnamed protein product [Linum tenue]
MRFAEYPRSPDPSPISGLVVEKKKQTATPLSRGSNLEAWLLRFIYPPCRFSEGYFRSEHISDFSLSRANSSNLIADTYTAAIHPRELIPPPALAKPASHKLMAAQQNSGKGYNKPHREYSGDGETIRSTDVAGSGLCEYEKLQCEMSDLQLKYYELLATRKVTLKEVFMRNHAAPCFTVSIQVVFLEKREMDIYALLYLFRASNAQFNSISWPFVRYRVEPFPETNCRSWKNAQQQVADSALHKLADKYVTYSTPHCGPIEKMDIGSEKTFDSMRPRRTEVGKQRANQRFVLLSDSCVPSYDFSCTYNYIMSSPKRLFDRLQLRHHL